MAITITEKAHWKSRITRKIDQAVEALLAEENPNFLEQIRREAKDRALESLGLTQVNTEVGDIEAAKKELDKKRSTALRRMLAIVRGTDLVDVSASEVAYGEHHEVKSAVRRRQELIEKELLAKHELGRRILRLQHEKDELLDTVWLAASPTQIKELWRTVSAVLNQEPTELQKEALNIEPMEHSKE